MGVKCLKTSKEDRRTKEQSTHTTLYADATYASTTETKHNTKEAFTNSNFFKPISKMSDLLINPAVQLQISFRGKKHDYSLNLDTLVADVKNHLASCVDGDMEPNDFKIIHKGKVLSDDSANMYGIIAGQRKSASSLKKVIRLVALGVSNQEAQHNNDALYKAKLNARRVRDDLSQAGRAELAARQRLGRLTLNKVARKYSKHATNKHCFGCIETLPMLPEQAKAKQILTSLANDPGILACMEQHEWNVGCLAEMYPEGKVGESEVCIMGLNQNKGQKILLRLRTDDLKGFRKILSIRKVLFHELAHNVHSEHDGEFFQLMRQVERECNDLDWTKDGNTLGGVDGNSAGNFGNELGETSPYQGGTYRLGGDMGPMLHSSSSTQPLTTRELAARAAMMRLSKEEEEIQEACGCNLLQSTTVYSEGITTASLIEGDEMDDSQD